MKGRFLALLMAYILLPSALAASVSITQSGADSGTIMQGKTFTVSVSGASSNAQASIALPAGFSLSGESSTKTTNNNGVVSWTTAISNQLLSAQTISVSIGGQGSPVTVTTSSFSVITPPSLSASISPSSASVTQGSTFPISLSIANNGQTTARFGTITVSPSFFSISSGCSPTDIPGGQSAAVSCTIAASSSASTGSQTMTTTIAASNSDALAKTVSVSVSASPTTTTTLAGGVSGGGSSAPTETKQSVIIQKIEANKPSTINITKEGIDIRSIEIVTSREAASVNIVVKGMSKPSNVPEIPQATIGTEKVGYKAYSYLEITHSNLANADIRRAKIMFDVSKRWLDSRGYKKEQVILQRYSDGWDALATRFLGQDNDALHFESDSPGLSIFAISIAVPADETVDERIPTPSEPETTTTLPSLSKRSPGILVPLIFVLIAIGAVYAKNKHIKLLKS